MPTQRLSFDDRLKQLNRELAYFNPLIGGWPPAVQGTKRILEVSKRWDKARVLAEGLLKERPTSLEAKASLGDLFRMGQNMDVAGAAQYSHRLLNEILAADPNYAKAHLVLAYLYVTVNAELAPKAEHHFLCVEELVAPEIIPDIYQGLGFACVYQDRIPEAIAYFEKYLAMREVPHVRTMLQHLKAGHKGQTIHK
jgi:hypothetical protein